MPSQPRLAILDDYQHASEIFADWSAVKSRVEITLFDTTVNASTDLDALIERLKPFEIICSMRERTKFPKEVLEKLPNLKLLTTTGPRNAAIDVKAAKESGIIVCGTGYGGAVTNEHNWALIMAVARNVVQEHNNTANGTPQWQSSIGTGLGGKTLGLIGLGRLGTATAKIAKAFDMKVQAWSPNLTRERAEAEGVAFVPTKADLLSTSDVISIHMVLAPSTTSLLTYEDLSLMKSTAILVNTSRGPIIEESGLIRILQEGKIKGAGLDVFDVEPLPVDHPIRKLKNVTLTPHLGYVADELYKIFWEDTVDNVLAYLNGTPKRIIEV